MTFEWRPQTWPQAFVNGAYVASIAELRATKA